MKAWSSYDVSKMGRKEGKAGNPDSLFQGGNFKANFGNYFNENLLSIFTWCLSPIYQEYLRENPYPKEPKSLVKSEEEKPVQGSYICLGNLFCGGRLFYHLSAYYSENFHLQRSIFQDHLHPSSIASISPWRVKKLLLRTIISTVSSSWFIFCMTILVFSSTMSN